MSRFALREGVIVISALIYSFQLNYDQLIISGMYMTLRQQFEQFINKFNIFEAYASFETSQSILIETVLIP